MFLIPERRSLVFLFAGLLFIYSCSKSGDSAATSVNSSFTWLHNGVNHSANYDSAYTLYGSLSIPPYTIIAGDSRLGTVIQRRVEFNLTSFNTGTYNIAMGGGAQNLLTYVDDAGNIQAGVSGTLNITSNANNYMSGNFSATIINASSATSLLTGSFTNVPIR